MKLLLDTHIFLWYISADPLLTAAARDAIRDPANDVYLSVASVWEAVIKNQLGKLPLPAPPATYLPAERVRHLIESLPIDEEAVAQVAQLPPLHRDPFDRILIGQAIRHELTLVSVDRAFQAYPVKIFARP